MRIGLIARSDRTGLGNQTRNLARMIRPDEIMLINSKFFNGNTQYPEIYSTYSVTEIAGFPTNTQVLEWLRGVDIVITCEIFYNLAFVDLAKKMGVKTINQYNWEFADYLRHQELTLPDKLISPSYWKLNESRLLWGNIEYLPTPIFVDDFKDVREHNLARKGKKRFLHIAGRTAVNDRNGTQDLVDAMRFSSEDFELVIKAQTGTVNNTYGDPRITIDFTEAGDEAELYRDFDAMILPRRYGGQCLPMTEALCSGLPVIMTDVEPNNLVLPPHWLVQSSNVGQFLARTAIDLYTVNHYLLGERLDFLARADLVSDKKLAYNIGYREFSNYELETKWEQLINETYGKPENIVKSSAPSNELR